MKGFLYKDCCLMRAELWFLAVMQVIFSGVAIAFALIVEDNGGYMILIVFLMGFAEFFLAALLTTQSQRRDEQPAWIGFAAASPAGMDGQVRSKYYFILIEMVVILCCMFLTDTAVCVIQGDIQNSASVPLMLSFCGMLLYVALETPFIFRFGTACGESVRGAVIAFFVFLGGMYLLFGDLSILDAESPLQVFQNLLHQDVVVWGVALLPYATALLYYLSYRLSLKLYRKGAAHYEQ